MPSADQKTMATAKTTRPSKTYKEICKEVHSALFSLSTESQNAVLNAYFDKEARYEDPLIMSYTPSSIRQIFRTNKFIFSSIDKHILSVAETSSSNVIMIDALITYTLKYVPVKVVVRTVSKFEVNTATGKVMLQEDIWSIKDFINQVPIVGSLYSSIVRPAVGTVASLVMNKIGN
ncbi:hypothetical protein BKA69DRAFT_1125211 [Paraphysoderma sedebokerense]|nr:hypothetical protein BKA69DRAFT_1125211 [Paraphysoderma sedebokerense]